jgi:hypothetical protein
VYIVRCSHCRQCFFSSAARRQPGSCPLCRRALEPVAAPVPAELPALSLDGPPIPVVTAEPDSYAHNATSYRSVAHFYRERPPRFRSRERDVGLHWRDGRATYRAAWIEDTGELYVVQLGEPSEGGGHVELLVRGMSRVALSEALAGWESAQEKGSRSLHWLRARAELAGRAGRSTTST